MNALPREDAIIELSTGTRVGGSKGHVEEIINGSVQVLYHAFHWKPIGGCTGRYTCRDHEFVSRKTPLALLRHAGIDDCAWPVYEFDIPGKDPIVVVPLDGYYLTGIITYVKGDSYVHTLNTSTGFRRKLHAIGMLVTDNAIEQVSSA